jgi:gas vesicle protein GvpL/GvpF
VKTATYLYCVVRAENKPSSTGTPEGLPGATRPEAIAVAPSLWLVAANVPLDVYGAGPLQDTLLDDLEAVGRIALAHEAVVEHFATRSGVTVVPMKLFTMFSTAERAVADVAARRSSIEAAMERIEGAEEWGIRVAVAVKPSDAATPSVRASSGAAFLAAKKQARDDVRRAKVAAADAATAVFERLAAVARDARRRSQEPLAAGMTPPLLDAVFLVPLDQRERFTALTREEAEACSRAGTHMIVTGPWPAYNFIETEDDV